MPRADDDLQKWFDGLGDRIQREAAPVVEAEANALSSAQRTRLKSLEKPPEETGALEESCRVERGRQEGQFIVAAGGAETTDASGHDHAISFEFGTRKQPARSFFWSTYRERAAGIRSRIEAAIGRGVSS